MVDPLKSIADPHFKIFHELMAYKVQEILLVSSPYDAFIMEEDSSLASKIINEYHGLNLSRPPRITRVASAAEALVLVKKQRFDLVLAMPNLGEMDAGCLSCEIKALQPDIFFILLAHNMRDVPQDNRDESKSKIDNTYIWCCDSDILLAIIKNIEDQTNVDFDTRRAMVRVIIMVEDSPVYRSQLLPTLYHELVRQTQAVLAEGLNEQHRLLKMRARPKILTAATFEEVIHLYEAYKPYVYAILSDVRFPNAGKVDSRAGITFLKNIRSQSPDIPMLLLSREPDNQKRARSIPAVFLDKNSSDIREQIHSFFLKYLGFGDFAFQLPNGVGGGKAQNLEDFEEMLTRIPDESLMFHAACNHFSNWVMARAEVTLALELHKKSFTRITRPDELRKHILAKIHSLRKRRQQGIVTQFSSKNYDSEINDFVRIGKGSMGGKARGIAFMASVLPGVREQSRLLSQYAVAIPKTCVIGTQGFDDFVTLNNLHISDQVSDNEIRAQFQDGEMPEWLQDELEKFLRKFPYPLSIRSSSLLEDAQFMPYAGLYNTYMLPNTHPDFSVRLRHFIQTIKFVYASTWFAGPRAFSKSIGQTREDGMAVIIQQLVGRQYGDYLYPGISGVVQSYNFYPIGPMKASHGISHIALGFGKTVVDGERSLRFSPFYPKHLPQFSTVDDILANAQNWFYALDMQKSDLSLTYGNLIRRNLIEAINEFPVRLLTSTYLPEEERIRDADLPGRKVLTFASILKYGIYPLAEILREFLGIGRNGLGCEVEIEFGVDLRENPEKSTFYFLQIRPIVTGSEQGDIRILKSDYQDAVLYTKQALGHGKYETMADIISVRDDTFKAAQTKAIAREIGNLNRRLHAEKRPYLLLGPGRWGSADPWLGIPVEWRDISGVGAIVELQGRGIHAEPSQGSHFFQNITSLDIPYLTVSDTEKAKGKNGNHPDFFDRQWLKSLQAFEEGDFIRHVRLEKPLILKIDGRVSEAVLLLTDGNL